MKHLLPFFAVAALSSSVALATEVHIDADNHSSCSVDLHQQVTVGPDFIETRGGDKGAPQIAYHAPDQLAVGDDGVILTPEQQALMQSYQQGLHSAGRDVSLIAADAMDIALDGVGIALSVLAGADDPDTQEFLSSSRALRTKLLVQTQRPGDVYTFGGSWIDHAMGESFERELEPQLEALAKKSAGKIAWHALKAAFTGGASIERDAELAAEKVEKVMEKKAERLEARAEGLCTQLLELDALETDLHRAIPELQGMELLEAKKSS
ncbi:DUF2884 family protein [Microbulbifer sp. MCCC 1A16149]|uniref:DUF2884 family protein n=1 Tax=Microbulbifer sp. MCCC 1A16149 TaxID=3411322 RepID=UPI003D0A2FDF